MGHPTAIHEPAWLLRSLGIWVALILAEVLHGMARAAWLVPHVGLHRSNQIGVFSGSAIVLGVAYLGVPWVAARGNRRWLRVGLLWLVLTLAFEAGFGHFVMGQTWQRLAADYDPAQGGMLGLGMLVLALAPWWVARVRGLA
ncbi:MAG: hypothetical protein H6830_07420 [Planctomycetes bacterium]|nr:hypothetical protein [Planctomycetota bacterium]MCB9910228.1 hypothetical protein [Planctomycetota bacterium]HPF15883.1 hypothetical protein [Planctomycetota bacterium]